MKMSELRLENETLKQQLQLLTQQKESEKDNGAITQLKEKNRSLKKSIKDLKAEKVSLSGKIQTLEMDRQSKEEELQRLKAEYERLQQQVSELSEVHTATLSEVENLRLAQNALQEKAALLPGLQAELDRLQQVENVCNEKTAQVVSLQAELEQCNLLLDQVSGKASTDAAEYQVRQMKLRSEMEMMRKKLLIELETDRKQSGTQIASLQTEKSGLTTKVTELTEKLKLVATHLEKQLSEKKKIAYQYETSTKEHQAFKDQSEKRTEELMALLHKMAAELDAAKAATPSSASQPASFNGNKPASQVQASLGNTQPQLRLQELQGQLKEMDEINANQARELSDLSARLKRIHHAFTTPLGRLFSQLLGLNE